MYTADLRLLAHCLELLETLILRALASKILGPTTTLTEKPKSYNMELGMLGPRGATSKN